MLSPMMGQPCTWSWAVFVIPPPHGASPQDWRRVVEVRWHMFMAEHGHAVGNDGADNESRQSGEEA